MIRKCFSDSLELVRLGLMYMTTLPLTVQIFHFNHPTHVLEQLHRRSVNKTSGRAGVLVLYAQGHNGVHYIVVVLL